MNFIQISIIVDPIVSVPLLMLTYAKQIAKYKFLHV